MDQEERDILVGLIKTTLAQLAIDDNMTYDDLSAQLARGRHGPDGWEFPLIDALEELEERDSGRPAMFFLRCGSKIGVLRVSANDMTAEGLSRRRRLIVRRAKRGLEQARNIAQDPDLSAEYKAYLGAQAASLAVAASAAQKHTGLGAGLPRAKASTVTPDWNGLKALYSDD